jgi:hypothetical protein
MAFRIECDRCGESERVPNSIGVPKKWLQFHDLGLGDGISNDKPISGGAFCPDCVRELRRWRDEAPPSAMPMDPAEFRKAARAL